ncbi:MAG: hypothetical protein OXL95_01710 [Nitrospira sp.]|nr:hypothetical protein [Nitrospira sp.]
MMSTFRLRPEYRPSMLMVILVCGLVSAWAVPVAFAEEKEQTTITSQTMTVQGKSRQTTFEGMVVLTKRDFVMRANHMVVTFKKGAQAGQQPGEEGTAGQVDRIEASGNVVIEKSDGKATCGRALYYKDEEKLVLVESPMAWQGGTKVKGAQMTMFLKEERSVVEGGSHVVILEE